MQENPYRAPAAEPVPVRHVGGLLTWFCVTLVMVCPPVRLYFFASDWIRIWALLDMGVPGLTESVIIHGLLETALIAFSIVAGIRLARRSPRALQTAKRFFVAHLAHALLWGALPLLLMPLREGDRNTVLGIWREVATRGAFTFAVGFAYLSLSRRVAETYPDARR